MAMKDLGYPIVCGAGVAAAQEWYRTAFNTHSESSTEITKSSVENVA
jgi:hypothetical protein